MQEWRQVHVGSGLKKGEHCFALLSTAAARRAQST